MSKGKSSKNSKDNKTNKSNKDNKNNQQQSGLNDALNEIKQRFGEGAIMNLAGAQKVDVDSISSGALSLDVALGVGGIPKGRVVEIYGPEASGKTTLALHVVAEAQKQEGVAAYVDAEHAMDPAYAGRIGVDTENLLISQPNAGEQALQIVETLVRSKGVDVVIVDSVAALTPKAEIEGEMEDQQIGLQARLMSKALRKLTSVVSDSNTLVIFLNQTRMKIGVLFGSPETTTGGMALKFYSSVRIELGRRAKIKQQQDIVGSRVKAKVVKNKVAPPFREAEFDVYYNEGISRVADLVNMGEKYGVVERAGSWYKYGDKKVGQGMKEAKEFLTQNPKIEKQIKEEILKKVEEEKNKN